MIKIENYSIKKNKNKYTCMESNLEVCTFVIENKNISLINTKQEKSILEKFFLRMILIDFFKNHEEEYLTYNNQKILKEDILFIRKYDVILFDIDDTILSFKKAEQMALTKVLNQVGLIASKQILTHYHQVNLKYWEMVERNEITREQCLIKRFEEFLPLYGIKYDPIEFENLYRYYLNRQAYVIKDARKLLTLLKGKYEIYGITNGVKKTQNYRMKKANMNQYFDAMFISEEIGYNKPSLKYFDVVRKSIDNYEKKKVLIVGDSLTSDIKLANNTNIDSCWFNLYFQENKSNIKSTYEINYLLEIIMQLQF